MTNTNDLIARLANESAELMADWAADNQPVSQGGPRLDGDPTGKPPHDIFMETLTTLEAQAAEIERLQGALEGISMVAAWSVDEKGQKMVPHADTVEQARQALSDSPAPSDGWLPIESAPHAETVLLYRPIPALYGEIYVATKITGAHGPGWCTPDGFEIFKATHWRPLPKPPASVGE